MIRLLHRNIWFTKGLSDWMSKCIPLSPYKNRDVWLIFVWLWFYSQHSEGHWKTTLKSHKRRVIWRINCMNLSETDTTVLTVSDLFHWIVHCSSPGQWGEQNSSSWPITQSGTEFRWSLKFDQSLFELESILSMKRKDKMQKLKQNVFFLLSSYRNEIIKKKIIIK